MERELQWLQPPLACRAEGVVAMAPPPCQAACHCKLQAANPSQALPDALQANDISSSSTPSQPPKDHDASRTSVAALPVPSIAKSSLLMLHCPNSASPLHHKSSRDNLIASHFLQFLAVPKQANLAGMS
ncbi:MAG: hypothetical protein LQ345_005689 [Seirophora villosa]|nr:MAG: hypothetical protein LQ345_005689 [Seirophora villosa]